VTAIEPPRIAAWMLVHLMPADHDQALAGDLLESFRAGRSRAWYFRQVSHALVIQWIGSLFRRRFALIYAAAWAGVSPAWRLLIIRLYHSGNLIGPVWRLPWPWSTVCIFGLSEAEDLVFIWAGVLVYLLILLSLFGAAKRWRMGRAFVMSIAGYVAASGCGFAIVLICSPFSAAHGVDWRTLTLSGAIADFGFWANLMRLPYLVATTCALWEAFPIGERPFKFVA
jgi:hypothetical protein